jgi:hypothetical protein
MADNAENAELLRPQRTVRVYMIPNSQLIS